MGPYRDQWDADCISLRPGYPTAGTRKVLSKVGSQIERARLSGFRKNTQRKGRRSQEARHPQVRPRTRQNYTMHIRLWSVSGLFSENSILRVLLAHRHLFWRSQWRWVCCRWHTGWSGVSLSKSGKTKTADAIPFSIPRVSRFCRPD